MTPTTATATETKLLRVVRREFYDAYGAITYYLRVPVGMTDKEIEQHECWHDGIDKDSSPYRDGLVCVDRVDDSNFQVIKTLEPTGGVEVSEVTEIAEADLLLETEPWPSRYTAPFFQALRLAHELEKALGEIPESFPDLEAAYSACDSLNALLSQGISKPTTTTGETAT